MTKTISFIICSLFVFAACRSAKTFKAAIPAASSGVTGTAFYKTAISYNWKQRDSFALEQILAGNMPSFLKQFKRVDVAIIDSATGKTINAYYFVSPDYLSIGNDDDWARVPLTPMTAQQIADSFHCFLPTRKMVDDIYRASGVKLEPVPMYSFRDSSVTMWQHHLIIEGQRKNRKGLIAGIKKDVVITGRLTRDKKADRVAIYGWHKPDGKAIQPLYTGHVNWYVDYSHGIRLIHRTIFIDGKKMDYIDVLKHPIYHKLICDEQFCDVIRY